VTRKELSMIRLIPVLLALALTLVPATATVEPADPGQVIVHEWGTFTSIADEQGQPLEWLPLGRSDLPCFVERFKFRPKETVWGTVRMETPVLYFYAPQQTTVRASVRFRNGLITEWFPRAAVTPKALGTSGIEAAGFASTVTWPEVTIMPGAEETYPTETQPNHYYAARQTDAAPIQSSSQREKFLFYRGVGKFPIPLSATETSDGRIAVKASGTDAVAAIVAFENRDGKIGYDVRHSVLGGETLLQPRLSGSVEALAGELVQALTAEGLFEREARAMVETWRDTWFEHGSRVFYIVPERTVDAVLPLDITPKPSAVKRVFVGRLELITRATREEVSSALTRRDRIGLERYGRFLQPIVGQLFPSGRSPEPARVAASTMVNEVTTAALLRAAVCR
jgi:hypothetical protein